MSTWARVILFASIYPYALYLVYFLWGILRRHPGLGDALPGYLFLLAFSVANLLYLVCVVRLILSVFSRRVTPVPSRLVGLFLVSIAVWMTAMFVYGDFLQQLPFMRMQRERWWDEA